MIFDYTYTGPHQVFFDPTAMFRLPDRFGLLCLLAGLGAVLLLFRAPSALDRAGLFVTGLVTLAGAYIARASFIDETYVNLEHSYNLFHHGLFSFSPKTMVDGTVEYAYYLLLAPFAWSRESLMLANYFLGLLIACAHFVILWRALRDEPRPFQTCAMLYFATNMPLVTILADGFGNSLISLMLLAAFAAGWRGRHDRASAIARWMPLVRPDAVVYSLAVIAFVPGRSRRERLRDAAVTLAVLGLYLGAHRFFYGHWVPTPVLFKAFHPEMLRVFDVAKLSRWMIHRLFMEREHMIFFFLWAASFWRQDKLLTDFRRYAWPMLAIFFFYRLSMPFWVTVPDGRYWVGWELYAALFPIICLRGLEVFRKGERRLVWLMLGAYLVVLSGFYSAYKIEKGLGIHGFRTKELAACGVIADEVVPKDWPIATTELNTFAFMNDREIIDLWGYVNRRIARSGRINPSGIRHDPDFFMETRPPVAWIWNSPPPDRPTGDYRFLVTMNFAPYFQQFGDMFQVIRHYDVFLVRNRQWVLTFLVRKDLSDPFVRSLTDHSYEFRKSEPIDPAALEKQRRQEQRFRRADLYRCVRCGRASGL